MATEDYMKNSPFGKVAGSLLASRNKEKKRDAMKALAIEALVQSILQGQGKIKQDNLAAMEDISEKHEDIFEKNSELFALTAPKRAQVIEYKENPTRFINREARLRFNEDPDIAAANLTYNKISEQSLDSQTEMRRIYDAKVEEVKQEMDKRVGNKVYDTITWTGFNAAAQEAYDAAIDEVEDDPSRKGLVRTAFGKWFGYGNDAKAELNRLATKKQEISDERVRQASAEVYAPEDVTAAVIKVHEEEALKTNVPFSFESKAAEIERIKTELNEKFNKATYVPTLEDMNKAAQHGVPIPGFSHFNQISIEDRSLLVSSAIKVRNNLDSDIDTPWNTGLTRREERTYLHATNLDMDAARKAALNLSYLEGREKDMIAAREDRNLTREDNETIRENRKVAAEITKINLYNLRHPKVETIDYSEFLKLVEPDSVVMTKIGSLTDAYSESNSQLAEIWNNKYARNQQTIFKQNVVEGALSLKATDRNPRGNILEYLQDSIEIQSQGWYEYKEENFFDDDVYKHEYVMPQDFQLFRNTDITTPALAQEYEDLLNETRYIQREQVTEGDKTINLTLEEEGKFFTVDDYSFTIININPNADEPPKFRWEHKLINLKE